ncbi:MAG: hypothetical protein ABR588_11675 [Sphingomicrobium sp.]
MNKMILGAVLASGLSLSACATNPYGYDRYGYNDGYNNGYPQGQAGRAVTGAVVGGVAGAALGAIVPGVSVGTGALAGAALGGVVGAVSGGHQWYRDTRGYCYYVDRNGNPVYDYNTRC